MEWQDLDFELPPLTDRQWLKVIDTALPSPKDFVETGQESVVSGNSCSVAKHSVVVLISRKRAA